MVPRGTPSIFLVLTVPGTSCYDKQSPSLPQYDNPDMVVEKDDILRLSRICGDPVCSRNCCCRTFLPPANVIALQACTVITILPGSFVRESTLPTLLNTLDLLIEDYF